MVELVEVEVTDGQLKIPPKGSQVHCQYDDNARDGLGRGSMDRSAAMLHDVQQFTMPLYSNAPVNA